MHSCQNLLLNCFFCPSTIIDFSPLIPVSSTTSCIPPNMRNHGKRDHSWEDSLAKVILRNSSFHFKVLNVSPGIFSVEGAQHTLQTRIVAPAFRPPRIKNMVPIFFRKAEELNDRWKALLDHQSSKESCDSIVDVSHWISRATFDVIGLAGFNYNFHSVEDESEPVYAAYRRMFNIADKGLGLREILDLYFPILRTILVSQFLLDYRNLLKQS